MEQQYVITISRQFGSLGRSIANKMSENLGIYFLDRDIVETTAKRLGQRVSIISDEEENAKSTFFRRKYPLGMGLSTLTDEIFSVQKNIIEDTVAKESCIIVGRCSDSILRNHPNHLNVYIYAPYEERLKNCTQTLLMDIKTAKKMIKEVDAARENYQKKYCPEVVNVFTNKDIMIDSSQFGVDGTAEILTRIVEKRWIKRN